MFKTVLLSLLLLLIALPVTGEYYQYKDAQGNLRFTDDTARIPEDKRTDVTAIESVKNESVSPSTEQSLEPVARPKAKRDVPANEDRVSIDAMRAGLDQAADSLSLRKQELKAQVPGEGATSSEKKAYFEKVSALNAEIDEYKKQRQDYNEKVKAFNARVELKEKNAQEGSGK